MDRALAFLSGTMLLTAAAAMWVYLPFWVALIYGPALIWVGWLLIADAIIPKERRPRVEFGVRTAEASKSETESDESHKLAA